MVTLQKRIKNYSSITLRMLHLMKGLHIIRPTGRGSTAVLRGPNCRYRLLFSHIILI